MIHDNIVQDVVKKIQNQSNVKDLSKVKPVKPGPQQQKVPKQINAKPQNNSKINQPRPGF